MTRTYEKIVQLAGDAPASLDSKTVLEACRPAYLRYRDVYMKTDTRTPPRPFEEFLLWNAADGFAAFSVKPGTLVKTRSGAVALTAGWKWTPGGAHDHARYMVLVCTAKGEEVHDPEALLPCDVPPEVVEFAKAQLKADLDSTKARIHEKVDEAFNGD